jgi:hypothetical protein
LLSSGNHPFAQLPAYYIENNISIQGIDEELLKSLNSPEYFTIYPALAQYVFWLAASLAPHSVHGSVLVIKMVIFCAEIGSLFLLRNLIRGFNIPPSRVLLYALNPLVIVELVGNSHLDALMIFFILLAIVFLNSRREAFSGRRVFGGDLYKDRTSDFFSCHHSSVGMEQGLEILRDHRHYLIGAILATF